MEPVLIEKDQRRIDEEKTLLGDAVIFLQELYNAFKAIGVTATLSELNAVTQALSAANPQTNYLRTYVANKLADKAGEPNFNGVPINRGMLLQMLEIPDLSFVEAVVKENNFYQSGGAGFRLNLFTLAADVVSKTPDADAKLEEEFTFYTINDRGVLMATNLKTLCDSLNAWNEFAGSYGWELKGAHDEEMIPGVLYRNGSFKPSLNFIRRQEALT